jgi:hypothetical protein
VAQRLPGPPVARAAQLERQAFQPPAVQSRDAQQERPSAEWKREPAGQAPRGQQASLPEPRLLASAELPAERGAAAPAQRQLPSSA